MARVTYAGGPFAGAIVDDEQLHDELYHAPGAGHGMPSGRYVLDRPSLTYGWHVDDEGQGDEQHAEADPMRTTEASPEGMLTTEQDIRMAGRQDDEPAPFDPHAGVKPQGSRTPARRTTSRTSKRR